MNGVLLWFAGLLVVLIGALFGVPHVVDWNSYRGTFEEEASRMLGREVRVGGDVTLRLLPAPYVSFEKPRIADTDIGEAFVRADSFTMWLALPPLVQGIIEAKQIEVKRPTLRLQVDKQGGGNWQHLQVNPGSLPFVPRGITLQSVKITDGAVGLYAADGSELARVEIPDGEFSAPALEGPYRFRADLKWGDVSRELRGSTAAPDPDGSIRLKAVMRVPSAGSAYTFEGAIRDPGSKPRAEGDITFAVARDRSAAFSPAAAAEGNDLEAVSQNAFEVRARLAADTIGAKLSDIAFSFEQAGRPQLLTGTAEARWQGPRSFRANLESKWLDLEKLSAAPANANAVETARRLSVGLIDLLPRQGEVAARIAIDQANFAGDTVSGLVFAVEDRGLGLKVNEMRATLPGGVRVDFSGELDRGGIAEGLRGDLLMRGSSLGRLLGWATRGAVPVPAAGDTGFALTSVLYLNPGGVELRQGTLDAGASRFVGDFGYKWGSRRALALSVESRKADISGVLPGGIKTALAHVLSDPAKREAGASSWPGFDEFDARIRVRADVLSDGSQVLNDVDTEILLQDGGLSIPRLRASTPSGFKIDMSGDVKDLAAEPKGSMRGVVAAATEPAMQEVINLAAIDTGSGLSRGLARMAPMRLAFVADFGSSDSHQAQLSLDGTALGKPLVANATLKGGWSGWRSAPMDAMVLAEGAQVVRLGYDALTGASAINTSTGNAERRGRLLLKAVGTPSERMDTLVQVAVDDLKLDARGHASIPDDLSLRFDGQAEITVPDAVEAFTFAGLSPPAAAVGLELQGKLGIAITEAGLKLDANRFKIGKSHLSGEINFSGSQDDRRIDASLNADDVSLPRLLAFVLDGSRAPPETDDALASNWREEPFDFDNIDHVRGSIKLKADALTLEEGFGLSAATVDVDLAPGTVSVSKLEGRALGGAVSSAFKLEKGTAGAGVTGVFGLWDVQLNQIVGAAEVPVAAGSANMTVQFSGQAVTPRALISVMTGKGELEFKSASMERLSPNAVQATTEAVLSGRVVGSGDGLKQELRKTLGAGPLELGSRTVPVTLGEGALRIDALSVDTPTAVVTNRTTIDLGELKIDSEWRFQPTPASRTRQTSLPGVSVVQVGPLLSYASLEPRIISDALERELAVRQMERNVEQLERLRREDEARAKAEAERLRAAERERLQRMQSGPQIEVPFPVPAPQSMQQPPGVPGQTAQQPAIVVPKAEPIEMTPLPPPRPTPAPRRPPPENSQWPPRW